MKIPPTTIKLGVATVEGSLGKGLANCGSKKTDRSSTLHPDKDYGDNSLAICAHLKIKAARGGISMKDVTVD